MPAPYPTELRKRVVETYKNGEGTFQEIADRFVIGLSSVERWVSKERVTGSVEPEPMGGANRPYIVDKEGEVIIRDLLDSLPDSTLPEVCEVYYAERKIRVSPQTMSDTVRRLGYSKKKGSFVAQNTSKRRT